MSDLRDYIPSNDSPRFVDAPMTLNAPIRDDVVIVDDGGLGDLHIRGDIEEEGAGRNKLFAGLAVALLVGVAGAWSVSTYMKDQPVVADNSLPQPSAPSQTAAMTPPPSPAPMPAAAPATPQEAIAPAAPDMVRPAPLTRQAMAPKMMAAPKSDTAAGNAPAAAPAVEPAAPVQTPVQTEASAIPEPVSPTPPASALAGNPALNEQSAPQAEPAIQPEPQAATPAPEAQAPVEAAPAAPAQ